MSTTTATTVFPTMMPDMKSNLTNSLPIPANWKSLFVPRISFEITKQQLRVMFEENFPVGKVQRIDFVEVRPENGSGRMAFIHFEKWLETPQSVHFKHTLETTGFAELFGFRVHINKKPVPPTDLNIDQLTDAHRILQDNYDDFKQQTIKIISDQQEMIDRMNHCIKMMNDKIMCLENRLFLNNSDDENR
jgi:hypothetical protein